MSKSSLHLIISLFCGLAVALLIVFAAPSQTFEAKGLFLPASNFTRTAYKGEVELLSGLPEGVEVLGTIRIQRHDTGDKDAITLECENLAKKLAAAHGANAVVISQWGHTANEDTLFSSYIMKAKAVRIPA